MPRTFHLNWFYVFFLILLLLIIPSVAGFFAFMSDNNMIIFVAILVGLLAAFAYSSVKIVYSIASDIDVLVLKTLYHTTKIRFSEISSLELTNPYVSSHNSKAQLHIGTRDGSDISVPLWHLFTNRDELERLLEKKTNLKIK